MCCDSLSHRRQSALGVRAAHSDKVAPEARIIREAAVWVYALQILIGGDAATQEVQMVEGQRVHRTATQEEEDRYRDQHGILPHILYHQVLRSVAVIHRVRGQRVDQ